MQFSALYGTAPSAYFISDWILGRSLFKVDPSIHGGLAGTSFDSLDCHLQHGVYKPGSLADDRF